MVETLGSQTMFLKPVVCDGLGRRRNSKFA